MGGEILSLPHVQAQSAVVALDGGNIRAYSTAGTPMWNYSARGRISPFVTRSREGTSYFSRTNGTLIAVNRAGRELWRRDISSPLSAKPVIGWDGRLFVPTDKRISCFTASGTLLWSKPFDSSFTIVPQPDRTGGILFACEKEVFRIDPFGNTRKWVLSGAPVLLHSFSHEQIVVIYPDGSMQIPGSSEDWFLGAQSHAVLLPSLPARPVAAASNGNNVAVVMNDGRISLVSIDESKILWTANSHIREGGKPETEAELLFDDRGIYVLSRTGATSFSHEGRRLWFKYLQNTAAIPAFGEDGVLYSGGRDWILYTYKIEDRPQRTTVYGHDPEGSYNLGRPQSAFMPDSPYFENEIRNKLEQIGAAVSSGRVEANEPAWTTFLLTLSVTQENIIFKISAINLLGKIGSRDTISWLINIFNRENEPSVRAAAINAIGDIGVDPNGIAIRTFLHSVIQGSIRNEQILSAIAAATGALCRFSGPPLSETGIQILNLLSAANQPPVVRRNAARELASLR